MTDLPCRGEVWWCEPPEIGRRPFVVLSRDAAISAASSGPGGALHDDHPGLASEVVLEPADDPVQHRSAVNLDSVESVSVRLLVERLGRLSDSRMREICAALAVATDCR